MCYTLHANPARNPQALKTFPRLKTSLLLATPLLVVTTWAQQAPPPDSDFASANPFDQAPATAPTPGVASPAPGGGTTGSHFQQGNPFDRGQLTGAPVDLSQAPGLDQSMQETELLAYALDARSKGNIPAARAAFQTLLARDPNNPQYARLLSTLPAHAAPQGNLLVPAQPAPPPPSPQDPTNLLGGNVPVRNYVGNPSQPTQPSIGVNPNPGPIFPGDAQPTDQPPIVEPANAGAGAVDAMEIDLSGLEADLEQLEKDIGGTKLLKEKIKGFKGDLKKAIALRKKHNFAESNLALGQLKVELEAMGGPEAEEILEEVQYELDHMLLYSAEHDIERGLFEPGTKKLDDYERQNGGVPDKESTKVRQKLKRYQSDPWRQQIDSVSPGFVQQQSDLHNYLVKAKTQFVNGDYEGALETYRTIDLLYPNSKEAKYYQLIIAERQKEVSTLDRKRTVEMLRSIISRKWQIPVVKDRSISDQTGVVREEDSPIYDKLKSIRIPEVNLNSIELTRAITFLSQASVAFDFGQDPKGVNIIPNFDPSVEDPLVNLTLRNMSLERILEVMVDQVKYNFQVTADSVIISKRRPGDVNRAYILEFYPLAPATILKLTGGGADAGGGGGGAVDPFAPAPAGGGIGGGDGDEERIKDFFRRSGIPLDDPESSFAFDGSQLIIRHTQRVHTLIQDLLRRYDTGQTQVEIEAKFLEVQQGDLEELGFNWAFHYGQGDVLFDDTGKPKRDDRGFPVLEHRIGFKPQTRTLSDAFTFSSNSSQTTIARGDDVTEYDNSPPRLPNTLDLANNTKNIFNTMSSVAEGSSTILGAAQVDLIIRALQRSSGTELLSAPRVTVNDQQQANITIAQEFRYPEDYDPGQIAPSGTGFTGAVPNTFTDRNVGVELAVQPQVLANDTINLHLEPTVTEFEGFVEYGGNNVVISSPGQQAGGIGGGVGGGLGGGLGGFGGIGNQEPVVIVQPSGIYQPIFSVRRVVTDVTIYDGATVVIGGLTREEVKTVNDRVPVLSNIPGLGRLFRSEGESSLKRNLMIFVTGNIISPGGGPARQDLATIPRASIYQDPIIITPAGPERRAVRDSE